MAKESLKIIDMQLRIPAANVQPLIQAAIDFVAKVESGKAHSFDSYNKFKKALEALEGK